MKARVPIESYPGFKFLPTENELILYYLRRKMEGFQQGIEAIGETDITRHKPWDLPGSFSSPHNLVSVLKTPYC